jgi:hypothetical protein
MIRWVVVFLFVAVRISAQLPMNMGGTANSMEENILRHTESGTDIGPASAAPPMLMKMSANGWMTMLHGEAVVTEQQQTGPRGHDKFFAVNWIMPMAQKISEKNEWAARLMLSLEPATITGRYYPELFQQGETAYGKPIVDGQHPHNLFMEIAAIYDYKIGAKSLLEFYAAPVGDPALGPEAFPHRASIGDNPLAPLGHHLEDSTHIADEVVTFGTSTSSGQRGVRVEASGFHGREPDENRWHIEVGAVDSWSTRLTISPDADWSAQYSIGHLHSPESLRPTEDVLRQTASLAFHHTYSAVLVDGIGVWGRNHTIGSAVNANGYLMEIAIHLKNRQAIWTRFENADRTTDLLGANAPAEESVIGRVQEYSFGYAHPLWKWSNGWSDFGAQLTTYGVPSTLGPLYSQHPFGVVALFAIHLGHQHE